MSKGILIVDMPRHCRECELYIPYPVSICFTGAPISEYDETLDSCPLKNLPQKKEAKGDYYKQREIATQQNTLIDFDKGFNACIDEILGDE